VTLILLLLLLTFRGKFDRTTDMRESTHLK
jgi:hypothetical protein